MSVSAALLSAAPAADSPGVLESAALVSAAELLSGALSPGVALTQPVSIIASAVSTDNAEILSFINSSKEKAVRPAYQGTLTTRPDGRSV